MNKLFNKILTTIDKYSSGKNVLIFFTAAIIVYFVMLFVTIPNVMNYANGMELFDLQPTGYSAEYAKALLDTLGSEGRQAYLYYQIPLDMVYPLLFALTYSLMLFYLFKKILKTNSKLFALSIVPLIAGFFDYLENIGIIIMLVMYPGFSTITANVTNIFSILKSFSTTLFFLIVLSAIGGLIYKKLLKK
ncbi:MAG: hypothetical protein D8M61_20270 [Ignavibacteriae bacterium]|nr:hypothetical protein [Ignavibacteriota bacterium]